MTEECPWSSVDVKVAGDGGGTAASNPEYTWSQTADEVTFEMPVLSARKSSLTATTDGHKLKVTSDRGRLVVELYASVIVLDRAKMRRGTLILTMRKMHAETWPSFERDVQAQSAHQEIDGGGDDGATRASPGAPASPPRSLRRPPSVAVGVPSAPSLPRPPAATPPPSVPEEVAGSDQISVRVPAGALPGMKMRVKTRDGRSITITIPEGATAGTQLLATRRPVKPEQPALPRPEDTGESFGALGEGDRRAFVRRHVSALFGVGTTPLVTQNAANLPPMSRGVSDDRGAAAAAGYGPVRHPSDTLGGLAAVYDVEAGGGGPVAADDVEATGGDHAPSFVAKAGGRKSWFRAVADAVRPRSKSPNVGRPRSKSPTISRGLRREPPERAFPQLWV